MFVKSRIFLDAFLADMANGLYIFQDVTIEVK